jgi:hypothetical protein
VYFFIYLLVSMVVSGYGAGCGVDLKSLLTYIGLVRQTRRLGLQPKQSAAFVHMEDLRRVHTATSFPQSGKEGHSGYFKFPLCHCVHLI